jgi:hypothetical protein
MDDPVGPLLVVAGGRAILVVSAIRDDNPEAAIESIDYGARIQVHSPGFLRVTRATLQWHLGRRFTLESLEAMMLSSTGQMISLRSEIQWRGRFPVGGHASLGAGTGESRPA